LETEEVSLEMRGEAGAARIAVSVNDLAPAAGERHNEANMSIIDR
jgi:hypothetical protein